MKINNWIYAIVSVLIIILAFWIFHKYDLFNLGIIENQPSQNNINTEKTSDSSQNQTAKPKTNPYNLADPIAEFQSRITKKPFGIYITPQNSPVQPEKFTGYHTAVDVEYQDVKTDVSVYSIANGALKYSGYVNGYGGFVAIQYEIGEKFYIGIYGHLNPNSLIKKNKIAKGEQIGILGAGYSSQTDGERKHLHFGILKGTTLDFKGYVQTKSQLSKWIDPLSLYN